MAVPPSLQAAIALAKESADDSTGVGRLASTILQLLERAVAEMAASEITRTSRRGTSQMTYAVETTYQGQVLSEHKGSGAKPYRCPARVYDGLVAILGEADRPLLLDEIESALERRIGDRPAEHQIRVALRLWMHTTPSLVMRNRARYRASNPSTIAEATAKLWAQLRS